METGINLYPKCLFFTCLHKIMSALVSKKIIFIIKSYFRTAFFISYIILFTISIFFFITCILVLIFASERKEKQSSAKSDSLT
jgi:hypothetical protein